MPRADTFTLTVNGQRYERWEEIRVTREIDRMATDFNIAVSERFLASARDFPLGPFQECTVAIGGDPVLTGYIDNYLPEVEADRHAVRVTVAARRRTSSIARPTSRADSSPAISWTRSPARSPACSRSMSLCRPMSASRSPTRRLSGTKPASASSSGYAAAIGPCH